MRISRSNRTFAKGYEQGWTKEIFRVHKIVKRQPVHMYYLEDLNNEKLKGAFYSTELQKITLPETYEIDKIIKTRGKGQRKRQGPEIRWIKFFESGKKTWESGKKTS